MLYSSLEYEIKLLNKFILPMANNKSAKKRILITERNRLQNRFYKTSVKNLTKVFVNNLQIYKNLPNPENKKKVQNSLNHAYKLIDKAYNKNVFDKNTADRKKSKLAIKLKNMNSN